MCTTIVTSVQDVLTTREIKSWTFCDGQFF